MRSNGNLVFRYWVGDILRSQFGKKEKIFLDEIIFRIPQKKLTSIQKQPVAAIQFQTLYQPNVPKKETNKNDSQDLEIKNQTFHFQTPIHTLSSKRKRLIFPLDKLKETIGENIKIKNITLSIQPEHFGALAEFLLQRLRLVSYVNKESPAIFDVGRKLSARWGGPFFDQEEDSEKIEWIKVQNFFSFNTPNTNQRSKLTTSLKDEQEGPSLNKTTDPVNMRGVQIFSQNGFNDWHADEDGLRLEGDGAWVEIDWPVQTKINKNTWFFMNFGEGRENILNLKLEPFTENQELFSNFYNPQQTRKVS